MKIKKQIRKFTKLEHRLRNLLNTTAAVELNQNPTFIADFELQNQILREKRQKALDKIFQYALTH